MAPNAPTRSKNGKKPVNKDKKTTTPPFTPTTHVNPTPPPPANPPTPRPGKATMAPNASTRSKNGKNPVSNDNKTTTPPFTPSRQLNRTPPPSANPPIAGTPLTDPPGNALTTKPNKAPTTQSDKALN